MANRLQGLELFTFESSIVNRKLDPVSGDPGCARPQPRQFRRRFDSFIVLYAGFARLLLLPLMQSKHQVICRIVKSHKAQVRLKREARITVESGNLVQSKRHSFRAIERFHKRPLNAGHIKRKSVSPAREPRILRKPLNQV